MKGYFLFSLMLLPVFSFANDAALGEAIGRVIFEVIDGQISKDGNTNTNESKRKITPEQLKSICSTMLCGFQIPPTSIISECQQHNFPIECKTEEISPSLPPATSVDITDENRPKTLIPGTLAIAGGSRSESAIIHVDVTLGDDENVACNHSNLRKISGNLNSGAGGKYIFLCEERADNKAKLVDLKVTVADDDKNYCPSAYKRDGVDLNSGAKGRYIYFCRKYSSREAAIKNIKFLINENSNLAKKQCGNGWTLRPEDLNAGAGGNFIYLCFNK